MNPRGPSPLKRVFEFSAACYLFVTSCRSAIGFEDGQLRVNDGGSTGGFGDAGPKCGDNIIDGTESCDGFQLGGATCASATSGALPKGTLSCSAQCTFDMNQCTSATDGGMGAGGSTGASGSTGAGGTTGIDGSTGAGGRMDGGGKPGGCTTTACTTNSQCVSVGYTSCVSGCCQ